MKKLLLTAFAAFACISCSSMPDGIDEDAWAPYSPVNRTIICITTRATASTAFSSTNILLYYDIDNKEDRDAMGKYLRESEESATISIASDDTYEVQYKLTFTSPTRGTVEEVYTADGFTQTYTGTFILQ